jgi:hypothetical protein
MKYPISLTIAVALLAIPFSARAQTSAQATSTSQNMNGADSAAQAQAARMVPAQGALLTTIDAKKDQPGTKFQVQLVKKVRLQDGTELPSGTILVGQVAQDDMQMTGSSKLALQITEAQPKHGSVVPIKATIVGMVGPRSEDNADRPVIPGKQEDNTWTPTTLGVDQTDAISNADLHSRIGGVNSGVLVSNKDDVKLPKDSEIELAIASAQDSNHVGTSGNNK